VRRIFLLAGLFLLGTPAHAAGRCDLSAAQGPVGLPQTFYVKGECGTLALRPDGEVAQTHPPPWAPAWAKKANARADARTYIVHPHRHVALLRDGRTIWRSRLPHGSDDVVVHGDAIAFTAYERPQPDLWVARLNGDERLAARGEDLDGWARSGGFLTRRGNELRLRAADGSLVRRVARVTNTAYDTRTESVVAVTRSHLLIRTDGRTTATLVNLRTLGFARHAWVEVLSNGLIKILADRGMLLLRPDGRRYASTPEAGITSNLLTVSGGVVFVVQRGGLDRIVLLQRGRRTVRVLDELSVGPRGCGYWANVSVSGDNVLYWPSTGHAIVSIDSSGRARPRDLWPIVRRLPGFRHEGRIYRAAWASAWNG
jgi:hypothetical protein